MAARKRAAKTSDDMPAFLRRKVDKNRTDSILRQETVREWIMPGARNFNPGDDMARKKAAAAKGGAVQIETADPGLPVQAQITLDGGKTEERPFANLQEFIDWFNPSTHDIEGSIADASVTMISVKEKERPKADKKTIREAAKKIAAGEVEAPEAKAVGRGSVIKKAEKRAAAPSSDKKPRGVGFVRHGVRVDKKEYGSVYKAFVELGLSIPAHVKFRAELKKAKGGRMTYEEKGKKYPFELVELKK